MAVTSGGGDDTIWPNGTQWSSTVPTNASGEDGAFDPCAYYNPTNKWLTERFVLVAVIGTLVCLVSIVENTLLLWLFCSRAQHWASHHLFLLFLSLIDVFLAVSYICLMATQVLMDFYVDLLLLRLWHSVVLPMLTISHCAMAASSYLILAASWERYLTTVHSRILSWAQRHRPKIAIGAVVIGVLLKGGIYLELMVIHIPECAGTMNEYRMTGTQINDSLIYHIWGFYCRQILTVFLPFALLSLLNAGIVIRLRRERLQRQATLYDAWQDNVKRKANVRSATRMLVLVTLTYLSANVLNVAFTVWEYIDQDGLLNDYLVVYTFSVDIVSLLTIVAGALRLPIYCWCSEQLRGELHATFCGGRRSGRGMSTSSDGGGRRRFRDDAGSEHSDDDSLRSAVLTPQTADGVDEGPTTSPDETPPAAAIVHQMTAQQNCRRHPLAKNANDGTVRLANGGTAVDRSVTWAYQSAPSVLKDVNGGRELPPPSYDEVAADRPYGRHVHSRRPGFHANYDHSYDDEDIEETIRLVSINFEDPRLKVTSL